MVLASPSPSTLAVRDYDFTSTSYLALTSINSMTLNLTLFDGDTGASDPYVGLLKLYLDNIDTGLLLNGFLGNANTTQTLTFAPLNTISILAALQVDGILQVQAFENNFLGPGNVNRVGAPAVAGALDITGNTDVVPEPSSLTLLGTGLLAACSFVYRRRNGATLAAMWIRMSVRKPH